MLFAFLRGILAKSSPAFGRHRERPCILSYRRRQRLARYDLQPGPAKPKMTMKNDNYVALVAMDWGDKKHAFARQIVGVEGIERGLIEATSEALHDWLEQLHKTCGGGPVALAIEAGRNALLHALVEYSWLTV